MAKRKKKNIRSKEKLSIDHPVKATQRSWPKKNIIEYVFVSLLSTYIIADFLPVFGYAYILKPTLNYIWLSLIGISSLSLIWINRRNLKGNTFSKNNASPNAFLSSYPKLAKIPVLGRAATYIYNQGIWINLGLLTLLVIGIFIYFYKLSYYNYLPDEPLVLRTAKGYLESGTFYKWDYWTNSLSDEAYPRAWPHTWLVAQSINLFGTSEFSARMVSSFSGLLTIPILYYVSNFFLRNRLAAFIITACLVFHPYTVHYFRRVRMYAILIPIFLLLFYYCYQAITSRKNYSVALFNKWPALKEYFNLHLGFIALALIFFYFNFQIHKISLVIVPAYFLFYLYILITKREKSLLLILLVALIPSVYFIFQERVWDSFIANLGSDQVYNPIYWQFLFRYPVTVGLSMVMVCLSLVWSVFISQRDRLIAILSLVLAGIVFYIFLIDYNDHYRYVIHLIPICLFLSIGMMIKINNLIPNKYLKAIVPAVILLSAISEYKGQFEQVYYNNIEAQFPKKAYPTIVNNINPETEAIFGLFFADYYLPGMGNQTDLVEITKQRSYTVNQFLNAKRKYSGVWVTWATRKSRHIDPDFYQHLAENCVKYHGYGIDNTLTEVFYCQ